MDPNDINDLNIVAGGSADNGLPVYDPGDIPTYADNTVPSYGEGVPSYGQSAPAYGQGVPPYGQNVPPYGQGVPPHVQNTAPYRQTDPSVFTDEDRKKANLLCIISLACYFFIPVVGSGVSAGLASAMSTASGSSGAVDYLYNIITGIGSISWIAAWVLMIYVRVRYSKSIFGKVLMWVYISFIVIAIAAIVAIIIACGKAISECPG